MSPKSDAWHNHDKRQHQPVLDAIDSGSLIRELRARGYETFPSVRVRRIFSAGPMLLPPSYIIIAPEALGSPPGRKPKEKAA